MAAEAETRVHCCVLIINEDTSGHQHEMFLVISLSFKIYCSEIFALWIAHTVPGSLQVSRHLFFSNVQRCLIKPVPVNPTECALADL